MADDCQSRFNWIMKVVRTPSKGGALCQEALPMSWSTHPQQSLSPVKR